MASVRVNASLKPIFLAGAIFLYVGASLWITNWNARNTKHYGGEIGKLSTIGQKVGHTFLGLIHVYLWRFERASWTFYCLAYPLVVISTFFAYLSYDLLTRPHGLFFSEFLPSTDPFIENAFVSSTAYTVATLGHILNVTILYRMLNGLSCRSLAILTSSIYTCGSAALTFVYATAGENVAQSRLLWPATLVTTLLTVLALALPKSVDGVRTHTQDQKQGPSQRKTCWTTLFTGLHFIVTVISGVIFISKAIILGGVQIPQLLASDPALQYKIVPDSLPMATFFVGTSCIVALPTMIFCLYVHSNRGRVVATMFKDLFLVSSGFVLCGQLYFTLIPFASSTPPELQIKSGTNLQLFFVLNLTPVFAVLLNLRLMNCLPDHQRQSKEGMCLGKTKTT